MPFAEVIGDPIVQSKSPVIHKHWLQLFGIAGDYVRTRVAADDLADFLANRRTDPGWRGCNVTIPHKQAVRPLLDRIDADAGAIGAVNCIVPEAGGLAGYNTDIDGVAAALDSTEVEARKVAIIGAGGGARAVVAYLARRGAGKVAIIVRNPERAAGLTDELVAFDRADTAFEDAAAVVNASPLGMAGAEPMPQPLLDAVRRHSDGATLFDLVTTPPETPFLAAGARTVDGLTMLIGQARRAFELFFGRTPPEGDTELRRLLTGAKE